MRSPPGVAYGGNRPESENMFLHGVHPALEAGRCEIPIRARLPGTQAGSMIAIGGSAAGECERYGVDVSFRPYRFSSR